MHNNQQYYQQHDGSAPNLLPSHQMSASSGFRSQMQSVDEHAYYPDIQDHVGYNYDANTQRSANSIRNTHVAQAMVDRPSTNTTDQMNSGRASNPGGDNFGSQRVAPPGIHQPSGHQNQNNSQQQFQRPPLGAHAGQGRIPTDACPPKSADPLTSFNEENDVYEISSLFDDVKHSQHYASYQAMRRDTDPGDEPVLDFNREHGRNGHGNIGASQEFQSAGMNAMNANSNFMSDREDLQSNQIMTNTINLNQYHPADTFNARAGSSLEGSVQEQQQDQFADAMENELTNLERFSQQNQLRTESKSQYNQSQYTQSQRLNQAQNSQSKEALFQTPKPGAGDLRRSEAGPQSFRDGGQAQRESQMTQRSMQKVNLFNDQMQQAMTQADAQNFDGNHARGPTQGSSGAAHGGAGGQLFDTPNQSHFKDRMNEQNQPRQSRVPNLKQGGRPLVLDKDEENAVIDWINSFDDPFLVLVSRIPQDLMNGVVLSHLVGYIACTADDRDKIFELLNYPKDQNGAMMGLQGSLQPDEVRENFDLAYNVLQYSQAYQEIGEEQQFLEHELTGGERISPESMAAGNTAHILFFLEGVQSLNFTLRQSRIHLNNLPLQNQAAGTSSGEAASLDQIQGKLTSSLPTNQDRYRPVSDLSQAPGKISPVDQNIRVLLTSEGSKLKEHSDLKQALSMRGFEPQTEQPSANRPLPTGKLTDDGKSNQSHGHAVRNLAQSHMSEVDELQRLEQEELRLMAEINKVDQVVSVMREDYEKIRIDQLNTDLVQHKRPLSGRRSPYTGSVAGQVQTTRPSNRPPRTMSSMGQESPCFTAQYSHRQGSATRHHQHMQSMTKSRDGAPVARFRANSYRENSAKRLMAWQSSMSRPLKHQHRRNCIQKKLLENMDYAHVIRKSYSRPQNSRTTDQLVIEETGISMTNSGEQSSKMPENPRADPTHFVSTLVKSVNLPIQQARPQAQSQHMGEYGQRKSVDFVVDNEHYDGQQIPHGTFGLRGVSRHANTNDSQKTKQYQQHNYQRLPTMDDLQKPPRPEGQQKHNYQKIVQEKKNIQVVKNERNFASFAAPQNEQCLDEIMSEMQTLNIRPSTMSSAQGTFDNRGHRDHANALETNASHLAPVDEQLKVKILDWLTNDVRLLKPMTEKQKEGLLKNFPQYSRTGVIFADLINRLNGRNEVIKGVHRNPPKGNSSQIQANFTKVMNYFKQFPRFCPRYLWSTQDMIQGNVDVIWGFFDDIWHWHFKKISPYDPAYKKEQAQILPSTSMKQLRAQGSSLERSVPQSQKRFGSSRNQDFEPLDKRGQEVQQQYQTAMTFQNRSIEAQPATRPPIRKAKPPQFDKNQLQLLQPRSILPQNMVFEKRSQSAKNSQAMFSGPPSRKGSTLQDHQLGLQSLVASASHNLAKNSIRRGHSSQAFSERQVAMSEKRQPHAHINKGHEYSQKVKTRNSKMLKRHHTTASGGQQSAKRSLSPQKREQRQKSSVGFDFSNQQELKKGIEPLFNESTGSFEHELNLLNGGQLINKKSYDLPLQKSPQPISPILKNKGKKQQHKFDATAKSNTKNRDLELIAGLFQEDEDGFDQYRADDLEPGQKNAAPDDFENQVVYKRKGKGFKIMNQFDIFPSGSERWCETNELMLSWNRKQHGNAGSRRYSPADTSDAAALGPLGPQQQLGQDSFEE